MKIQPVIFVIQSSQTVSHAILVHVHLVRVDISLRMELAAFVVLNSMIAQLVTLELAYLVIVASLFKIQLAIYVNQDSQTVLLVIRQFALHAKLVISHKMEAVRSVATNIHIVINVIQ